MHRKLSKKKCKVEQNRSRISGNLCFVLLIHHSDAYRPGDGLMYLCSVELIRDNSRSQVSNQPDNESQSSMHFPNSKILVILVESWSFRTTNGDSPRKFRGESSIAWERKTEKGSTTANTAPPEPI